MHETQCYDVGDDVDGVEEAKDEEKTIDAEGVGDKVLREILNAGFVPRWILYEAMHNAEPFSVTKAYVEQLGWRYVRKIGWNHVFEREGMFEA